MSSYPSQSNRQPKLSNRFHHIEPTKPIYSGHHAIVNCDGCNRTMVPRVVSYYGQPLKSICPFCGTTFMKFPSGLQQFWQRFHTRTLTFDVFKRIAIVAAFFGLVFFASSKDILPSTLSTFAIFGTVIFTALALAELVFQCVEQLAIRLSHESNLYWAALVLVAWVLAGLEHDLTVPIIMFSIAMLVRGLIAGFAKALSANRL